MIFSTLRTKIQNLKSPRSQTLFVLGIVYMEIKSTHTTDHR